MKKFYSISVYLIYICITCLCAGNIYAQTYDCLDCHDDVEISSLHADSDCDECHEDVVDESHEEDGVAPVNCSSCHDDIGETVKKDIHHRLEETMDDDPPDCVTCHDSHQIEEISNVENKFETFCSDCHENIMLVKPFHLEEFVADAQCLECHDDGDYHEKLSKSIHSQFICTDCHTYIANNLEEHEEDLPFAQKADCYFCHRKEALQHRDSIHGISLKEGINEAAQCWNCHGTHGVLAIDDENNKVHFTSLTETCASCHDNPEFVKKFSMSMAHPGESYTQSVHGQLVQAGELKQATCIKCHGKHDIKNRVQPGSKIVSFNIPKTCGECHQKITEEYLQSTHWLQAKRGIKNSPVCNDCHNEHSIQAVNTQNKKDEIRKIQENTCFNCHQDPVIAKRYDLSGDQPVQYQDSYHGLAAVRGDPDAALCVDCHNVHKILPKQHPESSVHPSNVTQTCKSCHEDATDVFSKSYSHYTESATAQAVEYWTRVIYMVLIIVVIGGMLFHNGIILNFEIRKLRKKSKNVITLTRLTPNEVVQHLILFLTFTVLAITGFALKYPDAWMLKWLEWIGVTETVRQYTHRGAGVLLLLLGGYHVLYLLFTRRGRDVLSNLSLNWGDVKDLLKNILFFLSLKKEKPAFGQFDYTEKIEYWALVWGTFIMGITGFVLWFPIFFSKWVPYIWFIKVNEIIHFYEAILATLAIFIWHFFFVIFHPKEYPMSFTWVDGKMSIAHYRSHHEKHFQCIMTEWTEYKNGKRSRDQFSHATELFVSELEKHGQNPDDIIQHELTKS